jgi:hypothetical protein
MQDRSVVLVVLAIALGPGCGSGPVAPTDDAAVADGGTDGGAIDCTTRGGEVPGPRREMAGAFDATRQRMLIFGGNTEVPEMCMPRTAISADIFALELECGTWSRVVAVGEDGPGARARMASTVDTAGERVLLFGGRDREGTTGYRNFADVWAFDLATDAWSLVSDGTGGPSPRSSAVIALDEARGRLIVFGGNTSTSGLTLTGADDLWALDLATGTWSELAPDGDAPGGRLFHSGVVIDGELVVFGGTPMFNPPYYADVWALDLATDAWRQVSDGSGGPHPRFGAELYADPARGRVLVFGGHDDTALGNNNDVWACDLATGAWTELRPGDTLNGEPGGLCMFPADFTIPEEGSPERRYAFARGQDATRGFVVGGTTDCGATNDVVALDLATAEWTVVRPSAGGEACNRSGRVGCTTLCY